MLNPGAALLLLAGLWDRFLGEPHNRYHPVAWIGTAIGRAAKALHDTDAPAGQAMTPFARGLLLAIGIPLACALIGAEVERLPLWLAWPLHLFLLKSSFSLWTLLQAAERLNRLLQLNQLDRARQQLSWLCSRDARQLTPEELAAATIESVAENLSDSLIAPLFFYACFGLPGALAYRAINTADAMIGYRGHYEHFGKAAARLDDVANFIPARLTAGLLLLAAPVCGYRAEHGWAVAWQDAKRTASPNAGVPMAAMAGLLHVRLSKPGHYTLAASNRAATPEDIARAIEVARIAGLFAFALCGTWLLSQA